MKRIITGLLLVSMASMTAVACSGDDDDSTGSGGKAGSGNTAGSPSGNGGEPGTNGGEPATNGGEPGSNGGTPGSNGGTPGSNGGAPAAGGDSGNVSCNPAAKTTCQNDKDCPFVADGEAREAAQTCGKGMCLGSKDKNCARDCILAKLAMSSSCASCYADFVNCTIANCLGQCLADPDGDACHTCQETKGCRPTFNECSGLPE